ncbi:MAG TPA: hypothetical protein DEQ02_08480 [Ruminococcaceae bacterium]|nr:hypothetical protein [Oscillospiraceae bacterium]
MSTVILSFVDFFYFHREFSPFIALLAVFSRFVQQKKQPPVAEKLYLNHISRFVIIKNIPYIIYVK